MRGIRLNLSLPGWGLPGVWVLLALSLALPAAGSAQDYMPPDLRSRVDQLKVDLGRIPTTRINAPARAKLVWDWLNAYAINGGYVPVDATLVVARVLGRDPQQAATPDHAEVLRALDRLISEFAFLDNSPDGIGTLTADLGPFTAATHATIQQTYTVGQQPIQAGGSFLVARHFMANFGDWQTVDAQAPHYISIKSSNPRVTFVTRTVPRKGMHGGFRQPRNTLAFQVASGTLEPGDQVVITYGDTSGGSPGILTPSFSSDRMPLPLYVSFSEKGQYFSLPIQPIKISGREVRGVTAFAPSIVKPGENFTLTVRARDEFYNRAVGDIPSWTVLLNGQVWQTLDKTEPITRISTRIDTPGTYFVTIQSGDGQIQGTGNPIWVSAEERLPIYWGDTHGHSGFAEGIGTPERFMTWARDDAQLDYVTHSEHDIWLDDAEWAVLRNNVETYSRDGKFVAFLGYEWTVDNTSGGHHNVLFRHPQNKSRVPAQFYPTLTRLYQGLRAQNKPEDVVVIPHAHQAGDYRLSDAELEPLVEIMSQHGNFEWFGRLYLQHGHQVGFIAASDNHLSQPGFSAPLGGSLSQRGGLGALIAPARTADDLFNAMKSLRTYATTGDRIIVDFSVNGAAMGERTAFNKTRNISGRVIGTAPIDRIEVVKNEAVLFSRAYYAEESDKLGKDETFLLTFQSDSKPLNPGDNPRGWRTWQGTLEVSNADIVSMQAYDATFPTQTVETSTTSPNRLVFNTKTRGGTSSYLLHLNNIQRTSKLRFDIVEHAETGGAPPIYRPHQRIPALTFELALKDMQQGRVSHRQTFAGYTDQIVLRKIVETGEQDVSFEFTDEGTRQGDYYYLRVFQANDAAAWSSPIWVGGHPSR